MPYIGTIYLADAATPTPRMKAIAALVGVTYDTPQDYVHYETNKTPEFTSKFPHGKIPALETPEGFLLTESTAITRYRNANAITPSVISRGSPSALALLGKTLEEQALVEQWCHFADTEVHVFDVQLYLLFSHKLPYSKPVHRNCLSRLERAFNTLEKVLETRTFFVSERLTLADVHVASVLSRVANFYLDKTNLDKYPSVVRFVETVLNQPTIRDFFILQWQEKAITYTPPPKDPRKEAKPELSPAEGSAEKQEIDKRRG